jgi:hypothetical protein
MEHALGGRSQQGVRCPIACVAGPAVPLHADDLRTEISQSARQPRTQVPDFRASNAIARVGCDIVLG